MKKRQTRAGEILSAGDAWRIDMSIVKNMGVNAAVVMAMVTEQSIRQSTRSPLITIKQMQRETALTRGKQDRAIARLEMFNYLKVDKQGRKRRFNILTNRSVE